MEDIMNAISEIVGILAGAGLIWLCTEGVGFIKSKIRSKFVTRVVKAAEQLIEKSMDEGGGLRLSYAEKMLINAGYRLDDALRAEIQEKVYDLNQEQRKGDAA